MWCSKHAQSHSNTLLYIRVNICNTLRHISFIINWPATFSFDFPSKFLGFWWISMRSPSEIHWFSIEIQCMSNVDFCVSFWDQNMHKIENIISCRMLYDVINMRNHTVIHYYILELTYTTLWNTFRSLSVAMWSLLSNLDPIFNEI